MRENVGERKCEREIECGRETENVGERMWERECGRE
jgi:hypothetical protein